MLRNVLLVTTLTVVASCSQMKDFLPLADMGSGNSFGPAEAWKDLPKVTRNYLNADERSGDLRRQEHQLDEHLSSIDEKDKCFGANGKKLDSNSLCKETSELISLIKETKGQIVDLHNQEVPEKKGQYYVGNVGDMIGLCVEDLDDYTKNEHRRELVGDAIKQMNECRPVLESTYTSFTKQSQKIRTHRRANELDLKEFDAFQYLNSSLSESKVKQILSMISKTSPSLKSQVAKNRYEPNWSMYCLYLESLEKADEVINNQVVETRRQKMIQEKSATQMMVQQMRSDYKKNTGKDLDESRCKSM